MNSLNTVLINSHYPHLTNTLFNNLILPPGLIKKEPPNIKYKQLKIHYTDECIDPKVFDKLVELIEIKSNKEGQYDKEIKSRNTRKSTNLKKVKEIKSRNTRKKTSTKNKYKKKTKYHKNKVNY